MLKNFSRGAFSRRANERIYVSAVKSIFVGNKNTLRSVCYSFHVTEFIPMHCLSMDSLKQNDDKKSPHISLLILMTDPG